ncbi:MAG: hypothetical protein CVU65_17885 [Deltaproteobacteria bacterium HGW-Deltaproteobacteria-22]|nr:MAG: hypothetical protein CVU65_17885 [Deltaproteobacteria bacterium HGW-Deltaproteobacteria-22]
MNHEPKKSERLGRYYLMDLLAYGGMAEIYRAKTFDNMGNEYVVVIKRVLSNLASNEELINMLVHEARIATMIHHPCVVRVYEFCQVQGDYFIVMELVDGKDLKTILERSRQNETPIPISDAVYVTICALAGLHTAHILKDSDGKSLQLIHRDMSPSNILISYTGEVKICDFGIAKTNVSSIQTRIGVVRGKVKYMSPEQAMGWKLDLRTDIYSVGSVLYEMLTNQPPFMAGNEVDMLKKIKEGRFTPLRQANSAVPPMLQSIVHKALSKDRLSRYQSAHEFSQALKQFLNNFAPTYTPGALAAWMEESFRSEHLNEQAVAGQYVFTPESPKDVGVNLLAENDSEDEIIPIYMAQPAAPASPEEVPNWLMRETTQVFELDNLLEGEPAEGRRETDQFNTRDLFESGQMTPTAVPEGTHSVETDQFYIGPTLQPDSPAIPLIESSEPEIIEKSEEPSSDEDFILNLSDGEPEFDEENMVALGSHLSPSPAPSTQDDPYPDGSASGITGEITGETELLGRKLTDMETPLPYEGENDDADMLNLDDLEEPEALVTTGNPSSAFLQGEIVLGGDEPEPGEERPETMDLDPFMPGLREEGSQAIIDLDPLLAAKPERDTSPGAQAPRAQAPPPLPRPERDTSPGAQAPPPLPKPERDTSPGTQLPSAAPAPGVIPDPGVKEETGDFLIELTMSMDSSSGSSYIGEVSIPNDPAWGGSTNPSVRASVIIAPGEEEDPS